ncbi:MAG: TIGR00296 family protein [Acidobacteriota bacterium]|nr:MAG: TIGR00296 family protein [Acidobacteriota bacterium]
MNGLNGLSEQEGRELLRLARHALESHFGVAGKAPPSVVRTPDGVGGVFATLKRDGELRGCIGYVLPNIDLKKTTERAVVAAATSDPRFTGVTVEELPAIQISISVLTEAVVVDDVEEIEIGRDGLVVERDSARGLLLPQVATERHWDRQRFLAETCVKAGLAPESWNDAETIVWRFAAVQFDEYSVNKRAKS